MDLIVVPQKQFINNCMDVDYLGLVFGGARVRLICVCMEVDYLSFAFGGARVLGGLDARRLCVHGPQPPVDLQVYMKGILI